MEGYYAKKSEEPSDRVPGWKLKVIVSDSPEFMKFYEQEEIRQLEKEDPKPLWVRAEFDFGNQKKYMEHCVIR